METLGGYLGQKGVIFVGKRPARIYAIAAALVLLRDGKVTLKARGRYIPTAVTAAIILSRRMGNDVTIDKVSIGEERMRKMLVTAVNTRWPEKEYTVSSIEIILSKNGPRREELEQIIT